MSLGGWKILHSGCKTVGRNRCHPYENGKEGVPTIEEYIEKNLPEHGCLGCDGRTIHVEEGKEFLEILKKKSGTFKCQKDSVGSIWENRPEMSKEQVYLLDTKYAGKSREEKIREVRAAMGKSRSKRTSDLLYG